MDPTTTKGTNHNFMFRTRGLGNSLDNGTTQIQNDENGEQDQYQYIYPTAMDRNLSQLSTESDQSFSSYQVQNYVVSPLTPYDSPQSNLASLTKPDQLSSETATPSQERSKDTLLFDIEKYGDPNIHWRMYYDFKVTKTEAYLSLKPGYLVTENYPARIDSDKVTPNDEKLHRCLILTCTARPFTRHYDLERHFKVHQDDVGKTYCDYKKCPHKDFFRRDHCREHYREYHFEDLIRKVSPKSTKPKEGQKQSESVENFLAARIDRLDLAWWRCPKCIIRVQVDNFSYVCPECKQACEPVRVKWREEVRKNAKGQIEPLCGQCINTRLANENNPKIRVPCPRWRKDG